MSHFNQCTITLSTHYKLHRCLKMFEMTDISLAQVRQRFASVKRTRRTFTLVAQLFRKQTYKLMYAGIVADAAGTNLIFSFLKTTAVTTGSRRVTTQKQFSSSRTSGTQRSRSPWYLTLSRRVHRAISLFIDLQSVSEKYSFFHAREL